MTTTPHIKSRAELQAEAEKFCNGGYASGGRLNNETDAKKDARMIKKAVGQHETHDHPGTPHTALKLRRGGKVSGEKAVARADKRTRRADGGAMPEKAPHHAAKPEGKAGGKGKGKININIIEPAAAEGEKKQAAMQGLQVGARLGAAQAARGAGPGSPPAPMPRAMPAPSGAGAGGPPPGAMPQRPMPPPGGMSPGQGPMKRGGRAGK